MVGPPDCGVERSVLIQRSQYDSQIDATSTASYDADGQITAEALPGGLAKAFTYDQSGALTNLTYTKTDGCSTGCTWWNEQVERTGHDQIATDSATLNLDDQSTPLDQSYSYDLAGRLTTTQDSQSGQCTVRTYSFDADTNRTAGSTAQPLGDGSCDTTGGTTRTHSYDNADRI